MGPKLCATMLETQIWFSKLSFWPKLNISLTSEIKIFIMTKKRLSVCLTDAQKGGKLDFKHLSQVIPMNAQVLIFIRWMIISTMSGFLLSSTDEPCLQRFECRMDLYRTSYTSNIVLTTKGWLENRKWRMMKISCLFSFILRKT